MTTQPLWLPTPIKITGVLSGGQRRCAEYGIVRPVGHISHRDMLDKLEHRADESGVLRCYICGYPIVDDTWELDHVRPLAAGGDHILWNVEPAHKRCNRSKADLDLYDPPLDDFVPLLDRLRATPTEDLWDLDKVLAKRVIVAPRPVPLDITGQGLPKANLVAQVLARQADPYGALALGEIAKLGAQLGIKVGQGELGNHWDKAMGVGVRNNNEGERGRYSNVRAMPSDLIVPTRVRDNPGQWGTKAFRLRFTVQVGGLQRGPSTYPDHDELDRPQPPLLDPNGPISPPASGIEDVQFGPDDQ